MDAAREPLHLLGVSVPRSGHHFLARLLVAAGEGRVSYCRFYDQAGCCGRVPCAASPTPIRFQKNHDLELRLPVDVAGARYLVQVRDPVPGALSDRELYAGGLGDRLAGDPADLMLWLARRALWLEDFWAKWVDPGSEQAVVVRYEALAAQPAAVLAALSDELGLALRPAAIAAAVDAVAPRGGFDGEVEYRPRALGESRFLAEELFALFETLLVGRVPGLVTCRSLPPRQDRTHPFVRCWLALRAERRGDRDAALRLFDLLSHQLGRPAALEAEMARLQMAAEAPADARPRLAAALVDRSDDPTLLLRWVELCRSLMDPAAALPAARRLVELRPDQVGLKVLLALATGEAGRRDAAREAVAAARAAAPTEPLDWCSLGLALLYVGLHAEAGALLDEALARWPGHAGLLAVQARNQAEAGARD